MYSYREIKTLHLEITTKCNARCPMCLRTVCGGETNPQLPLVELSLGDIQKMLPDDFVKQLDRMYICGNYGDPIAAQDTLDIYRHFRLMNPGMRLDMFTNGSARSTQWWRDIAGIVNCTHFSIDGLEDTNHIYRRGTHFPTILRNIEAYISAGGDAVWDYIVFKHNEHQLEEARELSFRLGFRKFNIKKTGRFFSNNKMTGKNRQVVYDQFGDIDYYIDMPEDSEYQNQALLKEQQLAEKYGSIEAYLDKTPIRCKVEKEKSIYLSAVGHLFPCCWTANQLYPWYYEEKSSYMWKLLNEMGGGVDDLNIKNKSIESVVDGPFFQDILLSSWQRQSIKEGRPRCCAKTCGSEFDPFGEQFK